VGPDTFQKIVVRRGAESTALTAPINATGVFELDPQATLRLPFEGIGVEGQWQFSLPRPANPIDYGALADVLISIDYTALDSSTYRSEVLRRLDARMSAERPFSFRYELADAWYDLHNPDQSSTPMSVTFFTTRDDFPPGLTDVRILNVTLYFSRSEGATFEIAVDSLRFTDAMASSAVGGAATTVGGVASTRQGNAAAWTPVIGRTAFGQWELSLPDNPVMRERFTSGDIADVLMVLTYEARTPSWPT
jgi:Tc toxin complex TcA C-terminal TcB-binding domain